MWGAYLCMGTYKCDVVVVIKMGTCIHGACFVWVLIVQILRYMQLKVGQPCITSLRFMWTDEWVKLTL